MDNNIQEQADKVIYSINISNSYDKFVQLVSVSNINKELLYQYVLTYVSMRPNKEINDNERYKIAKFCLDNGANPNKTSYYFGEIKSESLLELSIYEQSEYFRDYLSVSPLEMDFKIINLLIQYGADIHYIDKNGWTLLDIAVYRNHNNVTKILNKLGIKHSKTFVYNSSLWQGERGYGWFGFDEPEQVEFIETEIDDDYKPLPYYQSEIKRSFALNYMDYDSPIMKFFKESLENKQYDINELDFKDRTPLDFAIERGHKVAEELLRKYGGKTSKELEEKSK